MFDIEPLLKQSFSLRHNLLIKLDGQTVIDIYGLNKQISQAMIEVSSNPNAKRRRADLSLVENFKGVMNTVMDTPCDESGAIATQVEVVRTLITTFTLIKDKVLVSNKYRGIRTLLAMALRLLRDRNKLCTSVATVIACVRAEPENIKGRETLPKIMDRAIDLDWIHVCPIGTHSILNLPLSPEDSTDE